MTNGSFSKLRRPLFILLWAVIVLGLLSLGGMGIYRLGQSKEKATPTPAPTPTSVPTGAVSPSPTTKPKPTATPTATPTLSPTPTLTPAPSPTLTLIPQADLYVSEYSFNHPPKQGEAFTVRIGIYNKGTAPAGGFWWEWWPTSAIRACRERIDSLVARGGRIVTCTYTYGGWANYTTKAVLDVDNEVIESDESNNTYTQNVIPIH